MPLFKKHGTSYILFFLIVMLFCLFIQSASAKSNSMPSAGDQVSWVSAKTDHFLIWYTHDDAYFGKELIFLAENIYSHITNHLGLYPEKKITLYLAPSKDIFRNLQPFPSKIGDQAIGLAYPGQSKILLLSPRGTSPGSIKLQKVFTHELTHIILGQPYYKHLSPVPHLPQWFNEGLCMYEAKEWNWQYRALMTRVCLRRTLIPFRALEYSFPADAERLKTAYAQSFSLISYILNKYGEEALKKIARSLVEGKSIDKALFETIGVDLNQLEGAWKKHLRIVYTWVPILTSSLTIWFFISLIVLAVYRHKKRTSKTTLREWEEEEIEEWLQKFLNKY